MRLAHELLETWAPAKLPQPGVCRGEREPWTGPTSERAFPGGRGRERPGPLVVLWLRPWQPLLPASPMPAELLPCTEASRDQHTQSAGPSSSPLSCHWHRLINT